MKAIIIAAGPGSRLKDKTSDRPKCMLEFNGRPLLEHQMEALRKAGVAEISVIKGYRKEKINYPELKYYINDDYLNNNILHSLFHAEDEMDGEFIAVYSDILYDSSIVSRLMESKQDISILVDVDWKGYYEGRLDHPIEEAENVSFDGGNRVIEIGKRRPGMDAAQGEFVGMMKCSREGARIFREHFNKLKEKYEGKPFQEASVFKKAYLTDMFQDLTDSGIPVHCVLIEKGWKEIDTVEDYDNLVER